MKRIALILASVLTLSACAVETTRTAELTVEEGAKEECRYIEVSGSILKDRVCHNKATWAAIKKRDEENADKFVDALNDRNAGMPSQDGFGN